MGIKTIQTKNTRVEVVAEEGKPDQIRVCSTSDSFLQTARREKCQIDNNRIVNTVLLTKEPPLMAWCKESGLDGNCHFKYKGHYKPEVAKGEHALSIAVERLNRISERGGYSYFWSYTTNHAVNSSPYYYILWKAKPDAKEALLMAKALVDGLIEIIGEEINKWVK